MLATRHHFHPFRFTPLAPIGVLTLLLAATLALGQTPSQVSPAAKTGDTARETFEVASVRLVNPYTEQEIDKGLGDNPWSTFPTSRFFAHRITLRLLIALAYELQETYVQGSPDLLDSQNYEVSAKVEGDKQLTFQQMQPLLQKLLEERFQLACHKQTRLIPGYAVVVAKGGSKLKPSEDSASRNSFILSDKIRSPSTDMANFASMLSRPLQSPTVDKTVLKGYFDITLTYAPMNDPNSALPSIFSAIQDQLGLKLESQKVPVDYLIIDHVNREPTKN